MNVLATLRRQCGRLAWTLPQIFNGLRYQFSTARPTPLDTAQMARLEVARSATVNGNNSPAEPRNRSFRVGCWNISYGQRYEQVLAALKEMDADIYVLQEVDVGCRRSGDRNVAQHLARELSLHYVFGSEFQELAQQRATEPARHGHAILSRFPIARPRVLRFEHQANDWSRDFMQPRRGGRMALVAEIELDDQTLVIYNTHLESRGDEDGRTRQMQEILADAQAHHPNSPVIVAGDLNTRLARGHQASPVIECAEKQQFADATGDAVPCAPGGPRLDWILTRGLQAISVPAHPWTRASDHQPISADLQLPRR